MGDVIDKANEVADVYLNAALSLIKIQSANTIVDCIDCGDPIDAARKQAVPHAVRCRECEHYKEQGK